MLTPRASLAPHEVDVNDTVRNATVALAADDQQLDIGASSFVTHLSKDSCETSCARVPGHSYAAPSQAPYDLTRAGYECTVGHTSLRRGAAVRTCARRGEPVRHQ